MQLIQQLLPAAHQQGIELEAKGESCTISIAAEQLFQILLNLLQNAVRHTSTCVELSIEQPAEGTADWIFHVDDDGPGLSEAEQKHIFQRFYTGTNGVTGLGLAISKQIALRLDTDLVYNRSSLGGARFSLIHYREKAESTA